jgi:hypothetical protein
MITLMNNLIRDIPRARSVHLSTTMLETLQKRAQSHYGEGWEKRLARQITETEPQHVKGFARLHHYMTRSKTAKFADAFGRELNKAMRATLPAELY